MDKVRTAQRRYDLDWLRVLLFGLLVPFHSLGPFVAPEVFGITPTQTVQPQSLAGLFLFWSHSWRLTALFIISGIGTVFAVRTFETQWSFLRQRANRLLKPLAGGTLIFLLVATQILPKSPNADEALSLQAFLPWNLWAHLWFVANLFAYTIICLPLIWQAQRRSLPIWHGVVICIFLLIADILIRTILPGDLGKGHEFFWYLGFFALGVWLISQTEWIWQWVRKLTYWTLLGSLLTMCTLVLLQAGASHTSDTNQEISNISSHNMGWLTAVYYMVHTINALLWCLAIFGFATQMLNTSSPLLATLNRLVFPLYVLHMPVLFIGLALLQNVTWPWSAQFAALTFFTYILTVFFCVLLDKISYCRAWFGFKPKVHAKTHTS